MSTQNQQEMWQVEVNGQIYEASFTELTEWIGEGALLPGDKIRRGNLRWIEARKVPTLTSFFNAKEKGLPMPVIISTTNAETTPSAGAPAEPVAAPQSHVQQTSTQPAQAQYSAQAAQENVPFQHIPPANADVCQQHPDRASAYLCASCGGAFCKECPNAYGGVRICPACGQMCKPKGEHQKQQQTNQQYETAISGGFGFGDFGNAIAYPFKFKASLIMGAIMFTLFSLGQSAAGFGGIIMIASAIMCFMLANMLTFGILANTVENFAQGKIGLNFMPNFDDFSIWDDVLHPFFLSIGVYISSFGVFVAIVVVGIFMVINTVTNQLNTMQSEVERVPGTPYYNTRDTVQQSKDVKEVLDKINQKNKERLEMQEEHIRREMETADGGIPPSPADRSEVSGTTDTAPPAFEDTEVMVKEADELINRTRKQQLESTFGKTPETQQQEYEQMMSGLLKLAAPLVVFGFLSLVWGLFYFPAACAVAGYTRSFFATINPLVGLDTIKRLGFDYVKILFMGFLILLASGIVGGFLNVLFIAFDMPGVGNLPAKAFGSLFGFYLSVVFSCVLGFALYKASDRLKLCR